MSKTLFLALFTVAMLAIPRLALTQTALPLAEELRATIARAEGYRGRASDFEGASYFPSEWVAAEALLAEARLMPADADSDITQAIAAYAAAANSFASISRLAITLYAQAREDEIMMIRDTLVAASARATFPELVAPADRVALAALDRYEDGDYYSARDYAAQAHAMFQVLETTLSAWQTRREIVQRGFSDYAKENNERAEEIIADAIHAYLAGEFSLALENAVEAQARYSLVLSAGWAATAEDQSALADAERLAAIEIRANIAAREIFGEADLLRGAATDSLRMEYYREAAEQFADAGALYFLARISTLERRRIADAAIRDASRRIENLIMTAQRADLNNTN